MPPVSIMVKPVSGSCNMRCRYCFYADVASHRETASFGVMTLETLDVLVRRAFAYADGEIGFAFQGGEPTLAGLAFYEHLMACEARYNTRGIKIRNAIQTNAYALSDEMAEFFAKNGFLVGVSLDGYRETHDAFRLDTRAEGTYHAIRAGIDKLERAGAEFNILCVVNNLVAQEPERVFDALKQYRYIQFIACLDNLEGEKADFSLDAGQYARFLIKVFERYYEAYMTRRFVSVRMFDNYIGILLGEAPEMCSMSGRCQQYYLIEADGGVYPCDFYVLDRYRMGNIRDDSFYRLAKSPVGEQFRRSSWVVSDQCKKCRWFSLCRGGCQRDRTPEVDGRPGLNKWCAAYQSFFEACYPQMNEIAADIRKRDQKSK